MSIVFLLGACSTPDREAMLRTQVLPAALRVGSLAPGFLLATVDGKQVDLKDFRGQSVLVNFWATWCAPCQAEMPLFEEAYQKHKEGGLAVIGVNLGEPPAPVDAFARELGLSFPLVLDRDFSVSQRYKLLGLPGSFYVDKEGIIRKIRLGPVANMEDLARDLQSILPQKST